MTFTSLLELDGYLDELLKRKRHPFIQYKPLPVQKEFHQSTAWLNLIFGGNRSGKSRGGAQEALWRLTGTHPFRPNSVPNRGWMIAPEYRIIYEGGWTHLRNNLPDWEVAKLGSKVPGWDIPSYVNFKNGSRIDFISAESGQDRKKLQAAEVDWIWIDEEIGGDLWDEILARLTTKGGDIWITCTLIESEDWLLALENKAASDPSIRVHRLATPDNTYNSPEGYKRFFDALSPEEREVRIYGRSRKMQGLIYKIPEDHYVEPFPIPDSWTKIMCLDPGFRTAAALWVALAPDNKAYAYREMYLHQSTAQDWINFIRTNEKWTKVHDLYLPGEPIYIRLIDPAAFSHQVDGSVGIGTRLNELGWDFCPAINDKATNIEDVRFWLPNFYVFTDLVNFRTEVKSYRIKPSVVKKDSDAKPDRPIKKMDHLMNCAEYIASQKLHFIRPQTQEEILAKLAQTSDNDIDWPSNIDEYRMLRIRLHKKRRENRDVAMDQETLH